MNEIISLRKPREKHFLNEDGTFTLYAYDHDVHYLKNGKYVDIDNTIIEQQDCFKNKENNFSIRFAKNDENSFLLKIEQEDNYLNLDLISKSVKPQVLENSVAYQNILENIDIRYDVIENKVKDTIILKSFGNSFADLIYRINTNFVLKLNETGMIDVIKDGKCLFNIDKPTLTDKDGHDYPIKFVLEQVNGAYLLSFAIENSILENKNLYPLTIDPTIELKEDNSVFDTYIYPGDTNVNRNNQDMLKVGVDSNNVIYRTLMKFDLPTIGTACDIVDARVCLTSHPTYVNSAIEDNKYLSKNICVHEINMPWNEENANWNTMHDKYDARVENFFYGNRADYLVPGYTRLKSTYFSITNLVKRWYAGTENNGFLLKLEKETYEEQYPEYYFYSKNNTVAIEYEIEDPKPFLMVTYRNHNGLEDYMTYQTVAFTNGSSSVNNLTGNVTNVFEVNKTIGTKFPINLNLIYNTNDVILNKKYGLPKGFKFNYHEILKEVNFDNVCLEYTDGDGTIHYFYEQKIYDNAGENVIETNIIDEDGLGLTASKQNSIYVLEDKEGNKKEFILIDDKYLLNKIINTNKDYITINYNNTNFGYGISSISDNKENKIDINYNFGMVSYILVSSNYTTTIIALFGENNDKIQRISTKFETTTLTYNDAGIITKIAGSSSLAKQFDYYESIPYRLKKISEIGTNGEIGNTLEFFYGFNVTRIKDQKGRINTYSFNDQGNTIGITNLDTDNDFSNGYGTLAEYLSDFEGTKPNLKNKLQLETTPMKYTNNYLYNSSFEKEDNYLDITDEFAHSGNHSLKVERISIWRLPQDLEHGVYTFSAYIKTDKKATLEIHCNESPLHEEKFLEL